MRTTRAPLRGRSEELAWILAALRRATGTGQGTLVAVTGEPGIGKTALLREASEQARRTGFAVGSGKAEQIDQIAPGAPLLETLRSGPGPLLDGDAFAALAPLHRRPLWLVDRLCELIEERAAQSPVLIAVDDVQWIDPLTRFALRILPARLAGSPVVWLLGSRLTGREAIDELGAAAETSLAVTAIDLEPLDDDEIAQIATDHLGAVPDAATRRILTGAGGSPFWAVQVMNGLARRRAKGLPENDLHAELLAGLLAGIRRRNAALPPGVQHLIDLVAVWGRPMPVGTASSLAATSPALVLDAAHQARDEGILSQDESGLFFPHDLVREAIHADLPPLERVQLHRACGRYLITHGAGNLSAAPHFRASAGADDREAAEVIMLAAAESAQRMPEQAAVLAREAAGLLGAGHPDQREFGERALAVLLAAQRHGDAVVLADELLASDPPPGAAATIDVVACQALWEIGACREVEHRVGARLAQPGIPELQRAQLAAVRALASVRTESAPLAAEAARHALADGEGLDDELTQQTALIALIEAARNTGEHQVVLDRFDRLRSVSSSAHLAEQVRALQHLDRYDEAGAILAKSREGDGHALPSFLYAQIWQDHNLARLEAADAGARTLLQIAEETENFTYIMNARMIMFAVAIYRGDLGAARSALAPVSSATETVDELRVTRLRLVQGWLAAAEGDAQTAVTVLAPLLAAADDGRHAWPWSPPWTHSLLTIALDAGDTEMAENAVHIAELGARRNPGVVSMQGVALHVRGALDGDLALLGQAVEVLRASPRPMLLAAALQDQGRVLAAHAQAQGPQVQAVAALRESQEIFDAVGAWAYSKQAAALLDSLGVRRARSAPTARRASHGWLALTGTELRVAELVGSGLTNRSAAAELGVSTNTISTHLRAVFAKLDVHSRVQLAHALRDRSAG